MGRNLGGWGGWCLSVGRGLGWGTFKHGAGPLLRTCVPRRGEAARGTEGLWSVEFWSLEVGP